MFEDPDLQDPMSLSLNENCHDQSSQHPKKAQVSPEYNCEPPEIQVIIKEEEDGWTVSEYDESSEDEKEDASTHPYHPHLTASGRESSVSHGGKRHQRGYLVGKCSEESGGLAVYGQSSSTREERQKHTIKGYEQRPKISLRDQCNNTEQENTSSHVKNLRYQRRAQEGGECYSKDQRLDVRQSTSLPTEAEPHKTKQSARGQTDSPHHKSLMSCGLRREPSHLEDQTLHLTVRLQAGDEEEEEETAQEEEEDEEISGLINSDGEVVEWDAKERSNRGSDGSESPRSRKLKSQKLRDSGSPTLIMEVVSGEDEEREAREEKEREAKMGPASTSYRGRGARRQKRSPKKTALSVDVAVANKSVPPTPPKRRGKRRSSEVPLLSEAEMDAEPGMTRRTRGKRNAPIIDEPEEFESKSVRRVTGKRPCRKKKDAKPSIKEEGENTESPTGKKKRPGRKMIQYPVEIPPELLKKPKEKIEYHCSVCGKEFPHAYKLERHELIHTGEKPYCCSICGRGFNQKGNLKTHYKVHLGRKGAVDFPDEVNPSASELSEYLKSLPGESRIRSSHRCLECGKECESQSALQAHHITAHTGEAGESNAAEQDASQLLLCRRCGIQFSNKEKMEEHMKTHIKEKRYSCPDCGKRFINESYIQVHQRIHTGEKPYLCSLCGQGFHTASSLKLHEMQHSGERPFSCNICGKSFRINSYLTAHYQTHIKDRPFICSVCGKGYSRSEELKVHHRLHTGERPYECGECGKSFIYRQGLRQHQRTHAGRRMGPTRQLGRPKQESRLEI